MTTPNQRLFFALWPDDAVRAGLEALVRGLPEHRGRLVHPQDRHITLVFLGDVSVERRGCVEEAAQRVSATPCELLIDQVGYWPRPRILWCGASQVPAALLGLVSDLQQELKACGFRPETRPYAPHVTLARKAHKVPTYLIPQNLPWPVREFVLVASNADQPPPHYQLLRRWSLG
jgi:2'-5' RNA ligase